MDYEKYYAKYLEEGCIKIEDFLTSEEVDVLKQALDDMVKDMPEDVDAHKPYSTIRKDNDEDNSHKIGYFFEPDYIDSDGNLTLEKKRALKYVSYAIHWWNPQCKQITFSQKFKDLFKAFGYKDPVIFQSMLINKNPKAGLKFEPSQDINFFYAEPPTCICLWMPLEDTSVENGCLWFLPKSHKSGQIYQREVRNPDKDPFTIITGELPDFDEDKYVPIPTKKGDLGLLHGLTLHKGSRNNTDKQRAVFVLFAMEKESKWSELNRGQPNEDLIFSTVYDK